MGNKLTPQEVAQGYSDELNKIYNHLHADLEKETNIIKRYDLKIQLETIVIVHNILFKEEK